MSETCKNCKNFQAYYVKNDGKFYLTNRGYCSIKGVNTTYNYCCANFSIIEEKEKFLPITKENIENVISYLSGLLENIGVVVDEGSVGECKNSDDDTPYNSRLK